MAGAIRTDASPHLNTHPEMRARWDPFQKAETVGSTRSPTVVTPRRCFRCMEFHQCDQGDRYMDKPWHQRSCVMVTEYATRKHQKSFLTKITTMYFDTTCYGQVSQVFPKVRTSRYGYCSGQSPWPSPISALNTELALAPDLSRWSAVATLHLWYRFQGIIFPCVSYVGLSQMFSFPSKRGFFVNRGFCHRLYPSAGFGFF